MTRSEVLKSLAFLKKGRAALVADFSTEEPNLYRSMFLYEPFSSDMNIALDRYIFSWLAKHPSYFDSDAGDIAASIEISNASVSTFTNAYRLLCQKFLIHSDCKTDATSEIFEQLVKDSIEAMDSLLIVSKKYDDRLEKLRYQGEKSSHLFDRALANLKKEI